MKRNPNPTAASFTGPIAMPTTSPATAPSDTLAYWPHTTAANCLSEQAGVDLFNSPYTEGLTVIYVRFTDGTRWPARSVDARTESGRDCLASWCNRGTVNDYRA